MHVCLGQVWPTVLIISFGLDTAQLQTVPVVTIGSDRHEIDYGNPVTLKCSVSSYPTHNKVYWKKIGNTYHRSINSETAGVSKITISNPSMTILKATLFDSGTYQCFAENSLGTGNSLSTSLIVNGGLPLVSIGSAKYTTVYGQKITLSCSIKSGPVATDVHWLKTSHGNVTVINNGAVGTMGITKTAPSLEIPFPSYTDAGEYICLATNDIGTGSSDATVLTVTGEKPTVTVGIATYETDYGSSIVLACTVAATPFHFDVYWEKEDSGYVTRITSSTSGITGITKDNPSMTIQFATTTDTGIYTCFAVNYIGTGRSKSTSLRVNGGLPTVSALGDSYNTKQGTAVSLGCSVTAQPPVKQVYWIKKKGNQLTVINQGGVGLLGISPRVPTLTIQYPVEEDSGTYTCHAKNVVGSSSSSSIYLTVSTSDGYQKDGFDYFLVIGIPAIMLSITLGSASLNALRKKTKKCGKVHIDSCNNCCNCNELCNCCNCCNNSCNCNNTVTPSVDNPFHLS